MNAETLIEHFATFAESPNSVEKLRELVLQLAIRGQLVPQDPVDESAFVWLQRVGSNCKSSDVESTNPNVASADLPSTWTVVSLSEIADIVYGKNLPTSQLKDKGFPVFGANGVIGYHDRFLYELPQLLISCRGANSGKINMSPPMAFITNNSLVVELLAGLESMRTYLFHALAAIDRSAIITGTAQPQVTVGNAVQLRIPVPPLAEQKRIVAKVDQLLGLCDELALRQTARREARVRLVGATLDRLVSACSTAEFPAHVHRVRDNFDRLFDTATTVPQLRQAILQLAVQGQLVPQDPNDEEVEQLLARNDARRREIAVSDHRAAITNQPLLSAEDRWEIPATWSWRGLADLVLFVDYRGKTPAKLSSGVRLLTAKNVRKGKINLCPEEFLSERDYNGWMTRGFPKVGDILFTTEAPMGNAAVVELTDRFALAQRVICFQSYGAVDPAYLVMQILNDHFQFMLDKNGTGVTAKGIKASKLKRLPIAIPPIAEQKRIVTKVTELLSRCDSLEAKLTQAESASSELLSAAVHHLLST